MTDTKRIRLTLAPDKIAYVSALMKTPKFHHVSSLNAAVDMILTDYILNHKPSTPSVAEQPSAEPSKNSILSKLRKPPHHED